MKAKKGNTKVYTIIIVILILLLLLAFGVIGKGWNAWQDFMKNNNDTDDGTDDGSDDDGTDDGSDDDGGITCFDTDGGYDLFTYGECTDYLGTTADVCPLGNGNAMISESYCQDNVCAGVSTPCDDGYVCINGQCVLDQYPCEIIWNPSEQTCADGYCDNPLETCIYIPPDLIHPAKCECEVD